MSLIINLYNQAGAGPKNISLNFINYLNGVDNQQQLFIIVPDFAEYKDLHENDRLNIKLIKLPRYSSVLLKGFYRLYLEFFLIPGMVKKHQVKSILAFGNFLITPLKIKKVVLLHHPYLFDDTLFNTLDFKGRLIEGLKRLIFAMTLKNVDVLVVQSEYVKSAFSTCWKSYTRQLKVIPNPISDNFPKLSREDELGELVHSRLETKTTSPLKILFVSRYYPHKNHDFLLVLSKALSQSNVNHSIYVTLDDSILGVQSFMGKSTQMGAHIANLGEISQKELIKYYKASHLFIFPSKSETFGNPMIEAMKYGLPILVPDLPYTHAVVGESGVYYDEDDVEGCVQRIREVATDDDCYEKTSWQSYQTFKQFPTVSEWADSYIRLIS